MENHLIKAGALVVYKGRPGLVLNADEKIEIELEDSRLNVRQKDIGLIHPGPVRRLNELLEVDRPFSIDDIEVAWEILQGGETNVAELAELIYGGFDPVSAWAAWKLVMEGLHFRGEDPSSITACSKEEIQKRQEARQKKEAEETRWLGFLERISEKNWIPADASYLIDVEDLALGRRSGSRVLNNLGKEERPENAHAFLLDLGYWNETINPHPIRLGLSLSLPQSDLPEIPEENRRDLTHLAAYAIDDEDIQDPDDAVSMEGDWKVWVHTADAAVLAAPGSPADLEARSRGTNLYLPEITVPMLPPEAARRLGMGLEDVSPALSFGIEVNNKGDIGEVEVVLSWVRVTRLSYEGAAARLHEQPLTRLYEIAKIYHQRRNRAGAISIDLPEVKVRVSGGSVTFIPVPALPSRFLVKEAMVMAGEAAAKYALQNNIPVPYAAQPPSTASETSHEPVDQNNLAGMYALRRTQSRGRVSSHPAPHAGLGLPFYTRVTSPLRRYLDLAAHQQIRLFLRGLPTLDDQEMVAIVGESESITGNAVRSEFLSKRHWTLVHFLHKPNWEGEGVVVEKRGSQVRLIIPELAFETQTSVRGSPPLNSRMRVTVRGVNLPELEAILHTELGFSGDSG